MKKFWFLFLVLSSLLSFAQKSDNERILEDSRNLLFAIDNKDYDTVLDFTYPVVFQLASRDVLKGLFQMAFEGNEQLKMEFLNLKSVTEFKLSEIYSSADNSKYAFVSFPMQMRMILNGDLDKDQQSGLIQSLREQGMIAKFENSNTIFIDKQSITVALNNSHTDGLWKYINFDENNAAFSRLIPNEVMSKLIKYNAELMQMQKDSAVKNK